MRARVTAKVTTISVREPRGNNHLKTKGTGSPLVESPSDTGHENYGVTFTTVAGHAGQILLRLASAARPTIILPGQREMGSLSLISG